MKFISRKYNPACYELVTCLVFVSSKKHNKALCMKALPNINARKKGVLKKLDAWQDQRIWCTVSLGLYSIPGIVESWSICSEDVDWIPRDSTIAYEDYKEIIII